MYTTALGVLLVVLLYSVLYLYRRRGDTMTDMVTGLPSRDYFERYLQNCTARALRRPGYAFGVLLLDIRGFGEIRKTLGRFAAEEILADFAERVFWAIRPTDVLARLEKDNFGVILEEVHGIADVARVAMRIQRSMTEAVTLSSTEVNVQLNIGVTLGHAGASRDVTALLAEADGALTRAIDADRPYAVFDPALDERSQRELALEAEMNGALAGDQLELAYQPWFAPDGRSIAGVSTVLRWRHPERGLLEAREFIALADATRAIVPIGAWVLQRTVAALPRLTAGRRDLLVSVGIGATEAEFGDVARRLGELLGESSFSDRLRVELPASCLAAPNEKVTALLDGLRALGVGVHAGVHGDAGISPERSLALGIRGVRLGIDDLADADRLRRVVDAYRPVTDEIVVDRIETAEQDAMAGALTPPTCRQGNRLAPPMPLDALLERLAASPAQH